MLFERHVLPNADKSVARGYLQLQQHRRSKDARSLVRSARECSGTCYCSRPSMRASIHILVRLYDVSVERYWKWSVNTCSCEFALIRVERCVAPIASVHSHYVLEIIGHTNCPHVRFESLSSLLYDPSLIIPEEHTTLVQQRRVGW